VGTKNIVFLEVIEWLDNNGSEMCTRVPADGSGEIKYGAQLTVRESQAAVFFYKGRAIHIFGPGRHTLQTGNIPILNKILSIPWGMTSPLRAEVYFLSMKIFTDMKWGTRDPVAFRDSELGLVRLRAYGSFAIQIVQPLLFINSLSGTVAGFGTRDITDYLEQMIVSRFNDHLGEKLDTLVNLPGTYQQLADGLVNRLRDDFAKFGLALSQLYIGAITPPPEVQKAIDDKSKLGLFSDLDALTKMKAAMALGDAAQNTGAAGTGIGLMMPAMLSRSLEPQRAAEIATQKCPDCGAASGADAQFCPQCGHQFVVFVKCTQCGHNLPAYAKFCLSCGAEVGKDVKKKCGTCGFENLPNSVFCNQCGEKLGQFQS